jgi:hypothetical protein
MTTAVARNRISYLTNIQSHRHASFPNRRTTSFLARNRPIVVFKPRQSFPNKQVAMANCACLYRVFKKVINASFSSGLNSLNRLAGSRVMHEAGFGAQSPQGCGP